MEGTLGEVRLFAGPLDAATNKVPRGWKVCDGTLLQISENNGTVRDSGHDVRRRRHTDVRASRLARPSAGRRRHSDRSDPLHARAAGRGGADTDSTGAVSTGRPGSRPVSSVTSASGNNVQPVLAMNYIICFQAVPVPSRRPRIGGMTMWTRRNFLKTSAGGLAAATLWQMGCGGGGNGGGGGTPKLPASTASAKPT